VFCGLSILSLLDRLPDAGVLQQGQQSQVDSVVVSQKFLRDTIEWLSARQTIEPAETSDDEDEQEGDTEGGENVREQGVGTINVATIHHLNVLGPASDCLDQDPLNLTEEDLEFAGFNGRCNKIGDTCYSFWVVGALNVLSSLVVLVLVLTMGRSYAPRMQLTIRLITHISLGARRTSMAGLERRQDYLPVNMTSPS
jgi:geranylgeranyl transferase type-1 subunit beta